MADKAQNAKPATVDAQAESAPTLKQFLESVPPGRTVPLSENSVEEKYAAGSGAYQVAAVPQISLYCPQAACERVQFFRSESKEIVLKSLNDLFLYFTCKNCTSMGKAFALRFRLEETKLSAFKFGETPQFGPPLPAKLLQLAGTHGDWLKKGRQSENQSLGIGAFAYYRRVVETQKSLLVDELQSAVERLGGKNAAALEALEAARKENQFSKALELMADVTPKELFIKGTNPLKLLHGPLSVGLHGLTDEECLTKAHSIRVVLGALLDRVKMVTESEAELDAAIKDLLV